MAMAPDELADHVPGLLRYAVLLTRDEDLAADLVQETMLRALERGAAFRGEASPGTWLRRVLHNRFVDTIRTSREVAYEQDALVRVVDAAWRADAYSVAGEDVVRRAELLEDLADALIRLPVLVRSAVLLHDVEGLTSAEVAQVQGVALGAAKARIRRGRAALVSLLDGGPPDTPPRPPRPAGVPLRCWDARSRVDDYLDDDLEPPDRLRLERHLASCPTCPALYAALVGVRSSLRGRPRRDPESVVPEPLAARVRARLRVQAGPQQGAATDG